VRVKAFTEHNHSPPEGRRQGPGLTKRGNKRTWLAIGNLDFKLASECYLFLDQLREEAGMQYLSRKGHRTFFSCEIKTLNTPPKHKYLFRYFTVGNILSGF
jgi:hypothetical protein